MKARRKQARKLANNRKKLSTSKKLKRRLPAKRRKKLGKRVLAKKRKLTASKIALSRKHGLKFLRKEKAPTRPIYFWFFSLPSVGLDPIYFGILRALLESEKPGIAWIVVEGIDRDGFDTTIQSIARPIRIFPGDDNEELIADSAQSIQEDIAEKLLSYNILGVVSIELKVSFGI